jgi:hypothetical protein
MDINDKDIDEWFKKLTAEDERIKAFYKSEKFNVLIEIIRNEQSIDENDMVYGKVVQGMTAEEFVDVHECVFKFNKDKEVQIKNSWNFPESYIDYDGIRFELLIGHGAYLSTQTLEEEE